MKKVFNNKKGLTLVELIIATLLISMVFLAVSALYVASYRLFLTANDRVIISYELQYAMEHIYRNVMKGIGDETSSPGSRSIEIPDSETLNIEINNSDPLDQSNYANTTTYSYWRSGNLLMFDNGSGAESLVPKIIITDLGFALNGNLITAYLTGSYKDQTLTFYTSCYPRLASFQ